MFDVYLVGFEDYLSNYLVVCADVLDAKEVGYVDWSFANYFKQLFAYGRESAIKEPNKLRLHLLNIYRF